MDGCDLFFTRRVSMMLVKAEIGEQWGNEIAAQSYMISTILVTL